MKKRFLILAISLMLLCSMLAGCELFDHNKTDTGDRTMEFPDELKAEVLDDYLIFSGIQSDKKPDEIEYEFCGRYGDSTAIYFHTSGAYETPVDEEIAGYRFTYPDSRVIKIWNNGKFYKMSNALELGLISEDNVKAIHASFENIEFSEPYFIYEEKILCNVPVEEDFVPGVIVITLDKGISVPNEKPNNEFFVGVDIVEVQLIYKWTNLDAIVDKDNYNQGLVLILPEEYSTKQATLDAIKIIEHIDGVKCAWPNLILKNNSTPNDPYYTFDGDEIFGQWALTNIEIEKVWEFSTGSQNILVGIIDSGIASHNDLNPNYSEMHALDFMNTSVVEPSLGKTDTDSHGTHIAGIIGASGNNNIGISGINWRISLVQMHAIHPTTSLIALANAINYAADSFDTMGIRILNFSIGAPYELSEVEAAIRRYTNAGGLFVCSTGNDDGNNDASGQHQYPSHYGSSLYTNKISNIISVTSNNIENERAFGARWGQETIDIYAPGSIILSTFPEALCNQIDDDCAAGIMHNAYGYH